MKSKVTVTYQIDDVHESIQELCSSIGSEFVLCKNSIGILYSYSDVDLEDLVAGVSNTLNFPVVGCTCISSIDGQSGAHELSATLLVMTADDCEFSPVCTPVLTSDNVEKEVIAAYSQACSKLSSDPKLIYTLPPHNLDIMLDEYTIIINELAPGVPMVGGLHSANSDEDTSSIFFNGNVCQGCLAMLLISGNIQPTFSVRSVAGSAIERKRIITKSEKNVIYTVGNQRFTDYLAEIGLPIDTISSSNQTVAYITNPMLLENVSPDKTESYSYVRTLYAVDAQKGTGTAIGMVTQGATLSVCSLNKADIAQGADAGIKDITQAMQSKQSPDYTYSTVLVVSCIGRYTILLPNSAIEADSILKGLPKNLSLAGFYSHGEIGPLVSQDGTYVNHAHNESLILCAF